MFPFFGINIAAALLTLAVMWKRGNLVLERLLVVLFALLVLSPPIPVPGLGVDFKIRIEMPMVMVACGAMAIMMLSIRRDSKLKLNPVLKWFGLFGVSVFISITYATVFLGYPLVASDFMEFVKLIEYFLLFVLVSNMEIPQKELERF